MEPVEPKLIGWLDTEQRCDVWECEDDACLVRAASRARRHPIVAWIAGHANANLQMARTLLVADLACERVRALPYFLELIKCEECGGKAQQHQNGWATCVEENDCMWGRGPRHDEPTAEPDPSYLGLGTHGQLSPLSPPPDTRDSRILTVEDGRVRLWLEPSETHTGLLPRGPKSAPQFSSAFADLNAASLVGGEVVSCQLTMLCAVKHADELDEAGWPITLSSPCIQAIRDAHHRLNVANCRAAAEGPAGAERGAVDVGADLNADGHILIYDHCQKLRRALGFTPEHWGTL